MRMKISGIIALLMALTLFTLINVDQAVGQGRNSLQSVSVTVELELEISPQTIVIGECVKITVKCNKAAAGFIMVKAPRGKISITPIWIPAGGSISKVYPTDFPGGSTDEIGEYKVFVVLLVYSGAGSQQRKLGPISFHVLCDRFFVISQTPLGIIGVLSAFFSALGIKKHRSK